MAPKTYGDSGVTYGDAEITYGGEIVAHWFGAHKDANYLDVNIDSHAGVTGNAGSNPLQCDVNSNWLMQGSIIKVTNTDTPGVLPNADYPISVATLSAALDVDTILFQAGNTIRYTFNGTPDLSGISAGDMLVVTNATNMINIGRFIITAVNDGSDYVEVTNIRRSDNTFDEASDSPAVADITDGNSFTIDGVDNTGNPAIAFDYTVYVWYSDEAKTAVKTVIMPNKIQKTGK